jgi:hypothetical protein
VTDDPEDEVSETADLTLVEPPRRVELADLPQSPKSTFLAATAMGWEVHAWFAIGEVAPTLYVGNSDEDAKKPHNAGDVRYDGYVAHMFTVEARDPLLPIAFQAHYLGKKYADGRKSPLGSFDDAMVVDPVGVPRELRARYLPIKQDRGKYETTASFQRRVTAAQSRADEQSRTYNDGAVDFQHRPMFTAAREFDSWLAEWRSFSTQKAKLNV